MLDNGAQSVQTVRLFLGKMSPPHQLAVYLVDPHNKNVRRCDTVHKQLRRTAYAG
jgi:hypothetical protein